MVEMLKQVQHDTLNFSIILMKKHCCIILSLLLPLLFTSCLADLLNEKFGYTAPIYVSYKSEYGETPSRKLIEKGTALTSEYLPEIYADDNVFEGWYLDDDFKEPAQEGYIVNKSITLYAKWKYGKSKYQAPVYSYEVHFCFFDADNSSRGFEYRSEYTVTFDNRESADALIYTFDGYEYITGADATYTSYENFSDGILTKQITVIEKRYYKTHIQAGSFKEAYMYLAGYPDYDYTFYITDYTPDLTQFSNINGVNAILHFEDCHGLTEIPGYTFTSCQWLKEIYLPQNISKIGYSAFHNCANLKLIDTYSIVARNFSIEQNAFSYCSSLKTFMIPYSLSKIEQETFSNCTNLESIRIPSSVTEIVEGAFSACPNLRDVYYQGDSIPSTLQINDTTINAIKGTENWHFGQYWY